MEQKCEEMKELERKGRYDLMYHELKSLDYGKKSWKGMWLIEETRNPPAILGTGNETDISEDENGFPILIEEVKLAIKEMKNGKATRVDGNPIEWDKCSSEGKKEIL